MLGVLSRHISSWKKKVKACPCVGLRALVLLAEDPHSCLGFSPVDNMLDWSRNAGEVCFSYFLNFVTVCILQLQWRVACCGMGASFFGNFLFTRRQVYVCNFHG
jgi:hypothetical protein